MKYIKFIKETFIGCHLSTEEIRMALQTCNLKINRFIKGKFIHMVGEYCYNLEILLDGNIINIQHDQYGNELIIKHFEKNELLAGNILFGTSPKYPLHFYAQSNGLLLQINKSFLFELFIKKPVILRQFLLLISDRAIELGNKLKLGERKPLRILIMEYLLSQTLFQGSATITLPISKKELADRFKVQRTSVSREFSRMEKDGLITIHEDNKTIKVNTSSI